MEGGSLASKDLAGGIFHVAKGTSSATKQQGKVDYRPSTMSSTAEVFAAMKEAVTGDGGKALQRKFKVGRCVVVSN